MADREAGARTVATRARADIDAGRLWKARDRLSAAVRQSPTNQEALELLGEVYFTMGDGPAAWRYWALTARRGADVAAAEREFAERYRRAGLAEQLSQIPAQEPLEQYPEGARQRLIQLRERARAEEVNWPRPRRRARHRNEREEGEEVSGCFVATLVGLLLVAPWLLGFAAAVYLLVRGLGALL